MVRIWVVVCAVAMLAPAALADDDSTRQNFWVSLGAPNEAEVQLILGKARELRAKAISDWYAVPELGADPDNTRRRRANRSAMLRDAFGMLEYARRELNPRHPAVLLELGRTADELERTDRAASALAAYLDVAPATATARTDARLRLGRIYARRGRWQRAVTEFRQALATATYSYEPHAALYLGCAYMQTGRIDDAIDVLSRGAATRPGRQALRAHSVAFALAVAYDRDEQITAAYDTLAALTAVDPHLRAVFGQRYGPPISEVPAPLLVPPAERHYFAALRYEAVGQLPEARAEWQAYVRAADPGPYRDRARAHVAAIDKMRDEAMTAASTRASRRGATRSHPR